MDPDSPKTAEDRLEQVVRIVAGFAGIAALGVIIGLIALVWHFATQSLQ
jgi:hypothetical protein